MSESAEQEQQPFSAELSATVMGNAGILRAILSLVEAGQFIYVASTCTIWRAAYPKALEGALSPRKCYGLHEPVKIKVTSYAAVFSSSSRLRMAVVHGLKLASCRWTLCEAAGRHADLATLQLAAELGLEIKSLVLRGALNSGSLSSITKSAWLIDVHGVSLRWVRLNTAKAALSAKAPIEVLQWLDTKGVVWPDDAICIAAKQGSVSTLQYLRAINCPWGSGAPIAAASQGHLPALQYLLQEGCPFDDVTIADHAAAGGNIDLMEWLRTEHGVLYTVEATCAAASRKRIDALQYLVKGLGCETNVETWAGALSIGFG